MVADELEIKKAAADFDVTVTAARFTTTTPPCVRVVCRARYSQPFKWAAFQKT